MSRPPAGPPPRADPATTGRATERPLPHATRVGCLPGAALATRTRREWESAAGTVPEAPPPATDPAQASLGRARPSGSREPAQDRARSRRAPLRARAAPPLSAFAAA